MSLGEWLSRFREMHEKARRKQLNPTDLSAYRKGRDELAFALLAAQRLTLKPGETPRRALRVARALQVDLDLITSRDRAITIDISTGGFSCLLAKSPPLGDEVSIQMRMPASDPLVCKVRIADVKPQSGNVRVAFQFLGLSEDEKERLELFVFDTVLAQLSG
ncbi:MAG: PilZ domain-containing protein [Anaeromyxobacteraceae bacterium]